MFQEKVQYIFAGVCLIFIMLSAVTCLHLIQLRRAGLRLAVDIEMDVANSSHQVQLTTDTELDKVYPSFVYNTQYMESSKPSETLSFSVHQLFQSANGQTCIVCLEDFIEEESIMRELPCHHIYHKSCIDRWLITRSLSCPLCKEPVPLNQQQEETNGDTSTITTS